MSRWSSRIACAVSANVVGLLVSTFSPVVLGGNFTAASSTSGVARTVSVEVPAAVGYISSDVAAYNCRQVAPLEAKTGLTRRDKSLRTEQVSATVAWDRAAAGTHYVIWCAA